MREIYSDCMMYVRICVFARAYVCVCMRESARELERERKTHRERWIFGPSVLVATPSIFQLRITFLLREQRLGSWVYMCSVGIIII